MSRENVLEELTSKQVTFDPDADNKELKELLKQVREIPAITNPQTEQPDLDTTVVAGITPSDPQNGPSTAPVAQESVDTPLDPESVLEAVTDPEPDADVLMRWIGGYGTYQMGKYKVSDEDPFALIEYKDVDYLKTVGFVEVSTDQLKAFYA